MSTMFVSHERNPRRRKFQKPNILRKNSKIPKVDEHELFETPETKNLDCSWVDTQNIHSLCFEKKPLIKCKPLAKLKIEYTCEDKQVNDIYTREDKQVNDIPELNEDVGDNTNVMNTSLPIDSNEIQQDFINIESFLNSTDNVQTSSLLSDNESQGKNWSLSFMNYPNEIILEPNAESDLGSLLDGYDSSQPLLTSVSLDLRDNLPESLSDIHSEQIKHKCDAVGCNKEFADEQKLRKHRSVHNKEKKPPRPTTVECPARRPGEGEGARCGRVFLVREELLQHLESEHTTNEAPHECGECGRRFFFAAGVRAHARSHGEPAPRAWHSCKWPGCGRAFQLPCRLREHQRAHTGDKPYHCQYPDCGWSFRSASKLVRHSRRHTGERRHACPSCGRAFLRREHLRDHVVRYHQPRTARDRLICHKQHCLRTFTNMSSLYLHMKKVHNEPLSLADSKQQNAAFAEGENNQATGTEEASGEECHAARTHCTWPLKRESLLPHTAPALPASPLLSASPASPSPPASPALPAMPAESGLPALPAEPTLPALHAEPTLSAETAEPALDEPLNRHHHAYILEEDFQIPETSEVENNIYTIRSDLFLHGNILHSEDSENNISAGVGALYAPGPGGGRGGPVVDDVAPGGSTGLPDLGLLDAHSNIDLMQEELMYTDAVDESSFQVLLLSEELS